MLLIERRNRRNVQIFFLLITFLLVSGLFFWFFRYSDTEIDYLSDETSSVNQKNERELALEKVRKLQAGLNVVVGNTVYDDPSKNTVSENRDNFENAKNLFQNMNATAIKEAVLQNNGISGKMTADSFYDEKLKQKQEEDRIAEKG